jgi:hypothetical protein
VNQPHGPQCPCADCQKRLAEWREEEREQQREREEALWRKNASQTKDRK